MSKLLDDTDRAVGEHFLTCPNTHRIWTADDTFSSYCCPTCIPLIEGVLMQHKPNINTFTERRSR